MHRVSSNMELMTYCDASHGNCVDTGCSTGGYVTVLGGNAVGWCSKLQTFVTLSITEAEFVSAVDAGKEIMWMCNIMYEMGYTMKGSLPLMIDNNSAVCVTKNPEHHDHMKQLDLCLFWLREKVESEVISAHHIPGTKQVADILTKSLPHPKLEFCKQRMGIAP
jgi:hypothetical protein